MRHSITGILFEKVRTGFIFLLLCLSSFYLPAQICNLIEYHDFEEADYLQGWSSRDGVNGPNTGLSRTDSAVLSGNYAAKLSVLGDGANLINQQTPFSLQAGKYYDLNFWVRASDTAKVRYGVLIQGTLIPAFVDTVETRPGWREAHTEFQAVADVENMILALNPEFDGARGPYDLYVDFITLCEKKQTDACNLLEIPGFESLAFTARWSHYDGGEPGSSSMLLTNTDPYAQRFSAELKVNYFGGSGAFMSSRGRFFPIDSNAYYTFSAWMRSDVDSARIRAMTNRRTPYRELISEYLILDTVWREYTLGFQAPVNASEAYVRFIAKNAYLTQPYSIYIDNVRICQSGSPPQIAPGGVDGNLLFWAKANDGPNGRSVRVWEDRSGQETHMGRSGSAPLRRIDMINQNETVNFNSQNDRLVAQRLDLANHVNDHSWFVVLKGNNAASGSAAVSFYENGYRLETNDMNQWQVGGIKPLESTTLTVDADTWNIVSARSNGNFFTPYINGRSQGNLGALTGIDLGDSTILGALSVDNNAWWNGDIAEVIVYQKSLNFADRNRVNTYLSLKYGISIPVNQHQYYSYTSHPNLLTGIGQAEALMEFRQDKSRNVAASSILSISRPTRMDDQDFLVWGHDNGGTDANSNNVPADVGPRIQRTWRVAHTGNLGKVTVSFDVEKMGQVAGYGYALLVDKDGDFSNAQWIDKPYVNGGEIGFVGVSLEEGDYISLASIKSEYVPTAPARIADGLSLWLKADEGPNSNSVSTWTDLSPQSNSATAFDEGPRREQDQINGNPAVEFSTFRNVMVGASELYFSPTGHSYYLMVNTDNPRNWSNPFVPRESGYRVEVNGNSKDYAVYGLEPGGINTTVPSRGWKLIEVSARTDLYEIFENGIQNSSRSTRDGLVGSGPYHVGARNSRYSGWYRGKIAEIIAFSQGQEENTRHAIETYMAIKYGVNIPVASHLYYAHDSHPEAIAGIGKDAQQRLAQTNSKSIDPSAIVRMLNPGGLGEEEYLVWGHNGDTLDRTTNVPANYQHRFTRSWRISRTGNPGSVEVEFELAGLGLDLSDPAGFALLIDSDGDFSDAFVKDNAVLRGSKVVFKGVQFEDASYFSLAIPQMATPIDRELPSELLSWKLFPNPGQEFMQMTIQTRIPARLDVSVYDSQGRQMHKQVFQSFGTEQSLVIRTETWPAGLYFVRLSEGTALQSQIWMK